MLNRIQLNNFKASRDLSIRLASLTVLAGLNGSGKSTLLQALGVLRQSYDAAGTTGGLVLGGHLVQLGKGSDVLNEDADEDKIGITVFENDREYTWTCVAETNLNQLPFVNYPREVPHFIGASNFQFLQADRIVPTTLYPQAPQEARDAGFLGVRGEYTADFLALNRNIEVSKNRHPKQDGLGIDDGLLTKVAPTNLLIDQVAGWLQRKRAAAPPTICESSRASLSLSRKGCTCNHNKPSNAIGLNISLGGGLANSHGWSIASNTI